MKLFYTIEVRVGSKITFAGEKKPYTICACDDRYAVCTKPFNLKHTVLYTIIDVKENIRGTENLVFGMGAETKQQCEEMLQRLQSNESEITRRNRVDLQITNWQPKL